MKRFAFALLNTLLTITILAIVGGGLYGLGLTLVALGPWAFVALPVVVLFCGIYSDTDADGMLR